MALISCPECKRQVSDKAVLCPGCGYPLRQEPGSWEVTGATTVSEQPDTQPKNVLITGPSGIPLPEEGVEEFASFIEWIFGVKLNKDDADFIRQVLIEEWSRNDQLAFYFGATCTLLRGAFERETKFEVREAGHSDTRDYWRQALMHDFDLTPCFGAMPSALHKIAERLKVEPARRRLRPTGFIASEFGDLIIFITRKVYGIQGDPPMWILSPWKKAFEASSDELVDSLILFYLTRLPQMEGWPQCSEADRAKLKQLLVQDQMLGAWLETTRRALLSDPLTHTERWLELERLAIQQSTAPHLGDAMIQVQQERDNAWNALRWNQNLIGDNLKMWSSTSGPWFPK